MEIENMERDLLRFKQRKSVMWQILGGFSSKELVDFWSLNQQVWKVWQSLPLCFQRVFAGLLRRPSCVWFVGLCSFVCVGRKCGFFGFVPERSIVQACLCWAVWAGCNGMQDEGGTSPRIIGGNCILHCRLKAATIGVYTSRRHGRLQCRGTIRLHL
jgi:hypothetical protein